MRRKQDIPRFVAKNIYHADGLETKISQVRLQEESMDREPDHREEIITIV